jgi:hypothetical protein
VYYGTTKGNIYRLCIFLLRYFLPRQFIARLQFSKVIINYSHTEPDALVCDPMDR